MAGYRPAASSLRSASCAARDSGRRPPVETPRPPPPEAQPGHRRIEAWYRRGSLIGRSVCGRAPLLGLPRTNWPRTVTSRAIRQNTPVQAVGWGAAIAGRATRALRTGRHGRDEPAPGQCVRKRRHEPSSALPSGTAHPRRQAKSSAILPASRACSSNPQLTAGVTGNARWPQMAAG